jgi:hypothetical protein
MPGMPRFGDLVLYSDTNFGGRSFLITGERANVTVPFRPRSYRLVQGEVWQLCANTNFRSPCVQVSESRPDRGLLTLVSIRSARPVRGGGGGEFSGRGPAGPSLAGMASEFFRAPEDRGARVLACRSGPVTAACAQDTASRFCRARGYAGTAFSRMETVRGQTFLADVLCSRTGV